MTSPSLWRKVILFPFTRAAIAGLFLVAAFILRDVIANGVLALPLDAVASRALVLIVVVWAGYFFYVRLIERRQVRELSLREAPRELGLGILIGAGVVLATVSVLWIIGSYHVTGMNLWSVLLVSMVATAATAFWEELVFRGIIFRILEEGIGTWLALAFSAALFGLVHIGNENATFFGAVTITATAGVFLAGVYVLTRRLWVAIGAHYAVNLVQGPILGLPVSGRERSGIVEGVLDGPDLLTGGAYGIEASMITACMGVALAVYVVRLGYVNGRFVGPLWTRRDGLSSGGIHPELMSSEDNGTATRKSSGV